MANPGKPTLVMLPGALQDIETSSVFHNGLSADFNYYFLELPGTGCTTALPAHHSFEFIASCLYDFLIEYVCDPCHILACSYATAVALVFAQDHPEWVQRLVLLGAAGRLPEQSWPETLAMISNCYEKSEQFMANFLKMLTTDKHSIPRHRSLTKVLLKKGLNYSENQRLSLVYNSIRLMAHMQDDLSLVTCPTLCATGEHDPYTTKHCVEELASALPHGEVYFIPDADHLFHLEQPQITINTVKNFLLRSSEQVSL